MRTDWRGIRLKMAVKVPSSVLFTRHRRYANELKNNFHDLEDVIEDGITELCRLDVNTDPAVTPSEFIQKSFAHMVMFYRSHYRKAKGIYRDPKTKVKRRKVTLTRQTEIDLGLLPDHRAHADDIVGQVDEVLSVLTEDEQRAVSEVYFGRGLKGYAELLGITVRDARGKIKRSLKKMRAAHEYPE